LSLARMTVNLEASNPFAPRGIIAMRAQRK
jgi:hypothetical protein